MHSNFQVLQLALDAATLTIELCRPVAGLLRPVADQATRAAASAPLNIAEGNGLAGRSRVHHFRVARGSAGEAQAAVELLRRVGEVPEAEAALAIELWDRTCAMLWRLRR